VVSSEWTISIPGLAHSVQMCVPTYTSCSVRRERAHDIVTDVAYRPCFQSPPGTQAPSLHRNSSTSSSSSSNPAVPSPSTSASGNTGASEKERLLSAVRRVNPDRAQEVAELIASLPKKDRALCLFNVEILKIKMAEAREVLEAAQDDHVDAVATPIMPSPSGFPAAAAEDQRRTPATTPAEAVKESARAAAAARETPHTLASLAKLPASEIVRLASTSAADLPSSPLARPDPAVAKDIDDFVDGLQGKPPHEQKQKLGERLFKVVKSFGIKNSVSTFWLHTASPRGAARGIVGDLGLTMACKKPKVTIHLLDTEDLRALAHLMAEQPDVLREKVATVLFK
jgi:polyadenylate-binding protein